MAQDQSTGTDIFDQVDSSPGPSSQSGGDIFDQVSTQAAGPKAPLNPYANPEPPAAAAAPTPAPETASVSAAPEPNIWDRAKEAFEESTPGKNLALAGRYAKNTFDELHNLYRPIQGLKEIGSGADTLAGGPVTQSDILDPYHLGLSPQQEAAGAKRNPSVDQMAKGATQVMSGAMEVSKPLAALGIAAAPFRAAAEYGAGILAGTGAAQMA